mmetsp:Transcript_15514/g.17538  ORF Transcript_15514/g.17538 Transcript_15514/m.17538 type:complete len:375 (+) Transcript_15514:452-1576(+)
MGNCGGSLTEEQIKSREIEAQMAKEKAREDSKLKLLLLGAGESGKSTLFKQMKILYSEKEVFTDAERKSKVPTIHGNIYNDMKVLVNACVPENQDALKEFMAIDKDNLNLPEKKTVLVSLWEDPVVSAKWADRGGVQVQDSLEYYMDKLSEVLADEYVPSLQDILRSRVRTTGVVTETFKVGEATFEMYDVGGQRNERRKWIHSFENCTAILFVAAVSEYNQVLFEDNSKNRQEEAVELFQKQLKNDYFLELPFILFLNKVDLLREKLARIPFRISSGPDARNMDYQGPDCDVNKKYDTSGDDAEFEMIFNGVTEYLRELYVSQQDFDEPRRGAYASIYPHFTNSTDSQNIKRIIVTTKDIILKINLEKGGYLT